MTIKVEQNSREKGIESQVKIIVCFFYEDQIRSKMIRLPKK